MAIEESPKIIATHKLTKYCKIPILEDEDQELSFKPNDKIEILWEYADILNPSFKKMILKECQEVIIPKWKEEKIKKWLESNTVKVDD